MKKEDLFEGFQGLDEELLKRSEQDYPKKSQETQEHFEKETILRKKKRFRTVIRSIAAGVAIVVAVGAFLASRRGVMNFDTVYFDIGTDEKIIAQNKERNLNENELENIQGTNAKYEDIEQLLAKNNGQMVTEEQVLICKLIQVNETRKPYSAIYEQIASVGSDTLEKSIGTPVDNKEETETWYKVAGHKDMQYLISKNNEDTYSLWKFSAFQTDTQTESYAYKDVLETIYDIHSAEDIIKIIVIPPNLDNSDEGKAIQKEIGTYDITDKTEIAQFYEVISQMTCYGSNHWELIGIGGDMPSEMQEKTRLGRYLTIVTSDDRNIDSLKYTGVSGMFYEYGGIAYHALAEEEKAVVEEILQIR